MHLDGRWQKVVHDYESNVFVVELVVEHSEEFGQESFRILHQVHVVSG